MKISINLGKISHSNDNLTLCKILVWLLCIKHLFSTSLSDVLTSYAVVSICICAIPGTARWGCYRAANAGDHATVCP